MITGSPADRCGLKGGDVIVRFGRRHVIGICDDYDDALQQYAVPGDHVRIKVRRKTSTMTFEATLGPRRCQAWGCVD